MSRYPQAEIFAGVLALRMDAQFYFGNVTFLKEMLNRRLAEARRPVHAIVLKAATINHLDSSADSALHEIVMDLREREIEMYFANVRGPVLEVLRRSGFFERVGEDHFTLSVTRAVTMARAHVAKIERTESGAEAT